MQIDAPFHILHLPIINDSPLSTIYSLIHMSKPSQYLSTITIFQLSINERNINEARTTFQPLCGGTKTLLPLGGNEMTHCWSRRAFHGFPECSNRPEDTCLCWRYDALNNVNACPEGVKEKTSFTAGWY